MLAIYQPEYVINRWLRYNGLPADSGNASLEEVRNEIRAIVEQRYLATLAKAPVEYLPSKDFLPETSITAAPADGWRIYLPPDAGRPVRVEAEGWERDVTEFFPLDGPLSPHLTIPLLGHPDHPTAYYSPSGIMEIHGTGGASGPSAVYCVHRPDDGTYTLAPHLLANLYVTARNRNPQT